jgi:hypothetical protein
MKTRYRDRDLLRFRGFVQLNRYDHDSSSAPSDLRQEHHQISGMWRTVLISFAFAASAMYRLIVSLKVFILERAGYQSRASARRHVGDN